MNPTAATRIVFLEDDESAFELVRSLLEAEGFSVELTHAYDEETYRAALAPRHPDVILSDYNLPTIDGLTALEIRGRCCPEVPFILVSGALGEAVAIDLLKAGVTDFVLKDALPRLIPAIRRSLAEASEHRQRVQAQLSLRESEERFRRLAENAPDVIFRYTLETMPGRCDYISAAVERLSGYRPQEFYRNARLPFRIVHPDDRGIIAALIFRRELPAAAAEIRWIARDGRVVVTDQRFVPVHDAEGRLVALEGIARDVTAEKAEADRRRTLELQLNQAQKMESIGALAGGIAHDFNNILTGILGFTELAQLELGDRPAARQSLDEVRKAGFRAKELVAQILTFSRQSEARQVPLDLARVVAEALKFLRSSAPATVAIERQLASCSVCGDPTQIHQVVLNLCTNALHAMRGRAGTLAVRIEPVEIDAALAAAMPKVEAGPHACLTVGDTGHGMDEATLARVFDPFFTTKPVGEGTGLGLSVVQGIVATHRGGIQVESAVGRGTTFRVYFPVCAQRELAGPAPAAVVPGTGQPVLVVDDETSVATFTGVRLQQLNYRPAVYHDPRRALAAVHAAPRRFAALVTDFTMPGVTGIELIREVRRVAGPLPAVLITGNRGALPAELPPELILLDKPFSGDDLGHALHRLLSSPVSP